VVLSDGSADLTWVDPADGFKRVRSVTVRDGGRAVKFLNEVRGRRLLAVGRGLLAVVGGCRRLLGAAD
jgi:hypothetical protein